MPGKKAAKTKGASKATKPKASSAQKAAKAQAKSAQSGTKGRAKSAPSAARARTAAGAAEPLAIYRAKRDFGVTPEPSPDVELPQGDHPRFVVQEHHARAMHWDFRLERDGVLVSWAVPKGLPADPSVNHLAVQTEDHPMSYIDFAGEIPKGEYGGGTVRIWDKGWYELHKWEPKEVMVTLHGERVHGRYVLIRTREKQWLMHRMDPPEDPDREPFPRGLRPMLATPGKLPDHDEDFGFEIAWGGRRVLVYGEGGRVDVEDAEGTSVGNRYPELSRLGRELGSRQVVLDGQLVGIKANEQPVPGEPSDRSEIQSESGLRRAARDHPVALMLFDILYCEGRMTTGRPYTERRRLLEDLKLVGSNWQTPAFHAGDGAALLDAARAQGLPGIVAKRLNSLYQVGARSADWILVRAK